MSFPAEKFEGTKNCENCRIEYALYSVEWPLRERGRIECICGVELISWNGSRQYKVRFTDGTVGVPD
jgi:hypothetical protein